MKTLLLSLLLLGFIFSYGQGNRVKPTGNKKLNFLGTSVPLKAKNPLNKNALQPGKPTTVNPVIPTKKDNSNLIITQKVSVFRRQVSG